MDKGKEPEVGEGLRLIRLNIENFLRIKGLEVDARGNHVIIRGKNGSGKTSAIDALWCALAGGKGRKLDKPIRDGEDKAVVSVDLGEFTVEKSWTASGTRLAVKSAGKKVKNAQALLDGLFGVFALDPLRFLGLRSQDQVDEVLNAAKVAPPVDQVREITGEDCPVKEGESADEYLMRLSADETGEFYVERRGVGRDKDAKEASLQEARAILAEMGGEPKGDERLSSSGIVEELTRLQGQADERREAREHAQEARRSFEEGRAKLDGLSRELSGVDEAIGDLEQKLALARESREELLGRIDKGTVVVKEREIAAASAKVAFEELADPAGKIEELRGRLADAEKHNETLIKRRAKAEDVQRLSGEVEKVSAEHERLEGVLAGLRDLRKNLLVGADLGVEGLSVGEGQLMLNGNPFSQASHAERISAACAIARAQNPRLRVLRIDDGEHLDAEMKTALIAAAERQGFQVVMTCVTDHDDLSVEIVDAEGAGPVEAKDGQGDMVEASAKKAGEDF